MLFLTFNGRTGYLANLLTTERGGGQKCLALANFRQDYFKKLMFDPDVAPSKYFLKIYKNSCMTSVVEVIFVDIIAKPVQHKPFSSYIHLYLNLR